MFDSLRQLRVTFRSSASVTTAKSFVWCGNQICEERDGTGTNVIKRFFAEGEQRIEEGIPVNYYYTRDHLGSIREVTDTTGVLRARYDYDPYGNRVVLSGNISTDFGYTGHYFHQPSGLNLALYRAYNPALGRWISRDPLKNAEIRQGVNLYAYSANDPVNRIDSSGLYVQAPRISPIVLPALGWQLGLLIGNIPVIRDYFDTLFTNNVFNETPPPGINNPDPERNPEYRELVKRDEKDCWERMIEMEKAMGCALPRQDFEDRFRECMRDKGHGWY